MKNLRFWNLIILSIILCPIARAQQSCQRIAGNWRISSGDSGRVPSDIQEWSIAQLACNFYSTTPKGYVLTGKEDAINHGMYGTLTDSQSGCAMAVRLDNDRNQLKLTIYANANGIPCPQLPITPGDNLITFSKATGPPACSQNLAGTWTTNDAGIGANLKSLNIVQSGCRFYATDALLVGVENPDNHGMYGELDSNNPYGCAMAIRLDIAHGQLKLNIFASAHGTPCMDLPITSAGNLISFDHPRAPIPLQHGTSNVNVTPSCPVYSQLPNGSCCSGQNATACTEPNGLSCCKASATDCVTYGC